MEKLNLQLLVIILFFSIGSGFSQVPVNKEYERSNRYVQNADYNVDMKQVLRVNKSSGYIDNVINEEYVDLEINAMYNAKADSYLAIFSVVQNGKTAVAVDSMVNIRYNGFCKDLIKYGVQNEDIFLDMISLVPVFEMQVEKKLFSKTYNEVPVGFKLEKNIHVYYTKGEVLDKILTAAAKHEIYDLIKVEYFVNNTEAIYDTLFQKSVSALNKKVDKLKKLGIVLDTLKHYYTDSKKVLFPVDSYKAYNSYGGISLATKKSNGLNSFKKTPTMFYNKIPYHKYDIIMNPVFKEPAVQYTYNISVRYKLKPEKKEDDKPKFVEKQKNIYHIITPKGDIKKLNTN